MSKVWNEDDFDTVISFRMFGNTNEEGESEASFVAFMTKVPEGFHESDGLNFHTYMALREFIAHNLPVEAQKRLENSRINTESKKIADLNRAAAKANGGRPKLRIVK